MDAQVPKISETDTSLARDTLAGLKQPNKSLSPKYLYDQRGSELFEKITTLPEYYPTRTETAILQEYADQLAELVPQGGALVEYGSGASTKTRLLLDAGRHFGAYVPIDISADFLRDTAKGLKKRYPELDIKPVIGDFTQAIPLPDSTVKLSKVAFFPGSTIGNIPRQTAVDLLSNARRWPNIQSFILGVDLVKDPTELVAAYDDAQGITAAFIRNMLVRLNRDLDANFDLGAFRYSATWHAKTSRISMDLISTKEQTVEICGASISFAKDEPIHISAARKFTPETLAALASEAGWNLDTLLTDSAQRFAVAVLEVGP